MKNLICLLAMCMVLIPNPLNAQWVRSNGSNDSFFSFTSTTNVAGDTNLFTGSNGGGVFLSTDNGTSWTAVNKGASFGSVRALAVTDTNLFAAGYTVYLSGNNGKSWAPTTLKNKDAAALAISDTNVFAGTYELGIFRSSDVGKSWTAVDSGLTDSALYVTALFHYDTSIFAGTWGRGAFRSTNNGASWTEVNNGIVNHVHSFAVASNGVGGTNLFAGTFFGEGVYLSTNNGESWTPVNTGLTNKNIRTLAVSPNGAGGVNLYAGTWMGGVFVSTNNGALWTPLNSGMTSTTVNALYVSGSYLFAGTDHGVWRRLLSDTTTTFVTLINSNNFNDGSGLEQNYPNPFNLSTKISYQIPTAENVSLKVYDILGKEVSTLVNEIQPAGSYEVEFEAQGLTCGIYFYNLQAGSYAEIRKMTLLK
jgi:hypothetical protein